MGEGHVEKNMQPCQFKTLTGLMQLRNILYAQWLVLNNIIYYFNTTFHILLLCGYPHIILHGFVSVKFWHVYPSLFLMILLWFSDYHVSDCIAQIPAKVRWVVSVKWRVHGTVWPAHDRQERDRLLPQEVIRKQRHVLLLDPIIFKQPCFTATHRTTPCTTRGCNNAPVLVPTNQVHSCSILLRLCT